MLSMSTVDSFQGQERDIIAITLTRGTPQGEIGFLSDIRRMKVGMTRARRKLLLARLLVMPKISKKSIQNGLA